MTLRGSHLSTAYRRRLFKGYRLLQEYLSRANSNLHHLARRRKLLDACLEGFVNWAYSKKGPAFLSVAKHGLLVVQLLYPHYRRRLPLAWQTLLAWEEATEVRVRPPLPLSVLAAFVVFARAQACVAEAGRHEWLRFAVALELGFFGLLRPGEILQLRACSISLPDSWIFAPVGVVVRIEAPKNRRHMSRHQFVLVEHAPCCHALQSILPHLRPQDQLWPWGPRRFRAMFRQVSQTLGVEAQGFSPASLRAGGASHLHVMGMEISRLKFRGRWASERTLGHYVQLALSRQVQLTLSPAAKRRITTLLRHGSDFLFSSFGSSASRASPRICLPALLSAYGSLASASWFEESSTGAAQRNLLQRLVFCAT